MIIIIFFCYNVNGDYMKKKYYLFEMNAVGLNIISIVILVLMFMLTFAIIDSFRLNALDPAIMLLLLIPYLCFHEVLHSIGYVLCGADFKRITYGAHIEKGVLCCLCKQNVNKRCIMVSLLFPFVFIGVVTYIIGIIINNPILILLSIFNISGCSGDLLMFFNFIPLKNFEYAEYDNPIAFGLYSSDDLSKKKLFGLKYVGTEDKLNQTVDKKVDISKISIIYFVFTVLLALVSLVLIML